MSCEFSPFDREHDAAELFLAGFGGVAGVDAAAADVSDHWIDEALRAVPLPDGFLTRMSRLAQSSQPDASSANLA
jgi:hypothetical protein